MTYNENDFNKIQDYILKNPDYLWDMENQANLIHDVKLYDIKCSEESIINNGDLFIHDAIVRELWICEYTKRKYKVAGRVIQCKPIYCISRNTINDFGAIFNGCLILPKNY